MNGGYATEHAGLLVATVGIVLFTAGVVFGLCREARLGSADAWGICVTAVACELVMVFVWAVSS